MIPYGHSDWPGVSHWKGPFGAVLPRKEVNLATEQTLGQSGWPSDLAWSQAAREIEFMPGSTLAYPG